MKQPKLKEMPKVPKGSAFSLVEIRNVTTPHPYCITPKHVAHASDHCCGMLTAAAIEEAEKSGAVCGICKEHGKILPYKDHETNMTLFIKVPQNKDLNSVPGLHSYLFNNKEKFEKIGVKGFAFPT